MSVEAITWALSLKVERSTAKFILVAMANCANSDLTCWPSVDYLSDATCQDRKTVQENIKRLKEGGFIVDTKVRKGRTGQVIVYKLKNPENGTVINSTENGTIEGNNANGMAETVPKTDGNSTVFPPKEARFSVETGPKTGHGTVRNPKEPKGKQNAAPAPSDSSPIWKPLEALTAAGVDPKTAKDWLKLRQAKKAPVTETVLDIAIAEAAKANVTLVEALQISCSRGWAGFKAEWIVKDDKGKPQGAWYATEASARAKGEELGLRPLAGESFYTFKGRIDAALANGGKLPTVVSGQAVSAPKSATPEPAMKEPSPENRAAALDAARKLKPRDQT